MLNDLLGRLRGKPSATAHASPLDELLTEAVARVQAGDADGAQRAAEQALQRHADHAAALHLRGLAEALRGSHDTALEWFSRARRADPAQAAFAYSKGLSARVLGYLEDAIAAWEEAARLDPKDAATLHALGVALLEAGQPEEAVDTLARAVANSPEDANLRCDLGHALRATGQHALALEAFSLACTLCPEDSRLHDSLGVALHGQWRLAEALAAFDRALSIDPEFAGAHNNRGASLQAMGRVEEAVEAFAHALAIDPRHPNAMTNHAQALQETGRWREAMAGFAAAAAAGSAGARFRHALVLPVIAASLEEIAEVRGRIAPALDAIEADGVRLGNPHAEVGTTSFHLGFHGECDRELQNRIARTYLSACPSLAWTAPHIGRTRRPGRLRIGFLSRFLRAHSIGKTSRGLIERFSRTDFEVICIHIPPVSDDETARAIRAAADHNLVLPLALQPAREAVAALELDALFFQEIGLDPFAYYLAFARLAPVQCVSFGYPDTTGIPNMDWFISSDLYEPPVAQEHYSERLWLARQAGTLAWYLRPPTPDPSLSRDSLGLPSDRPLYFCPHSHFRWHPEFDDLLRAILDTDTRGEVVLVDSSQPRWTRLLRKRLERALGPHAGRLRVLPQQPLPRYLALMRLTDAMLDPIHFNGMNNSLDAFSAGVPVVTWPRALQRGRHTSGMYQRMGWDACVAQDANQYVQIAVRLAKDPEFRHAARREVAARSAVLFEDDHVVLEFERFFREACVS